MNERFLNITKDIYMLKTPAGGVWSGIILIDGEEKVLIDSGENAEHIDELLVPALKELGIQLQDSLAVQYPLSWRSCRRTQQNYEAGTSQSGIIP